MKRAIIRVPEGVRFDSLTAEQQAAIRDVFAEFALPVPGTIAANGYELVDGLTRDNFDPAVMPGLGMDWPVVGLWQWNGDKGSAMDVLVPLDEAVLLSHLAPRREYDEDGELVTTHPPVLHEPFTWFGWPPIL